MAARTIVACGVAVAIGAGGWYVSHNAPPACDSEPVLHRVTEVLRDQFQLNGIFVNNISTESGGLFSDRRVCSAEVAAIRGNVNASDLPWRAIGYQIDRPVKSEAPAISVTLGGAVPLEKPAPSLWERLTGWL